jgi:hypothetical protein
MTTDAKITGISPYILSDEYSAHGEYQINKNNLFVAYDESKTTEEVLCTLLHEATHLAANEVYQHSARPYHKWDSSQKKRYQLIKETTLAQINNWIPQNQKEWVLIEKFRNLLLYKDKDVIAELFVKVPEAIFILGYEQGLVWLNQHVPDLLKLYEEEFIPNCLQYLKYRQINTHFSLDSFFADTLQTTGLTELSLVLSKHEVRMSLLSFVALVCGIILAAINPATFILGLVLIPLAFIAPLTIAIKFHQVTVNRLAAMEPEVLPIIKQPIIVQEHKLDNPVKPPVFSHSNSQQVLQTNTKLVSETPNIKL